MVKHQISTTTDAITAFKDCYGFKHIHYDEHQFVIFFDFLGQWRVLYSQKDNLIQESIYFNTHTQANNWINKKHEEVVLSIEKANNMQKNTRVLEIEYPPSVGDILISNETTPIFYQVMVAFGTRIGIKQIESYLDEEGQYHYQKNSFVDNYIYCRDALPHENVEENHYYIVIDDITINFYQKTYL